MYIDSESTISYKPVAYKQVFSPGKPPPTPDLDLDLVVRKNQDGTVRYDLLVSQGTDVTDYPIQIATEYQLARPDGFSEIESIN